MPSKMRWWKPIINSLIAITLLITGIASQATQAKGSIENPYSYYYSSEKNTFIIESADDGDQYTLAKYSLPSSDYRLSGAGWSPSGEWFTWNPNSTQISVVHRREGQQFDFPSSHINAENLSTSSRWSPTSDMLYVLRTQDFGIGIEYFDFFVMNDIPSQNVIFEFSSDYDLSNSGKPTIVGAFWAKDGQAAYLYFSDPILQNKINFVAIRLDGRILEYQIGLPENECGINFSFSSSGTGYIPLTNTLIQATEELEITPLTPTDEFAESYIKRVEWSPNGAHAFIYSQPICGNQGNLFDLWVLFVDQQIVKKASTQVLGDEYGQLSHWSGQGNKGWFLDPDSKIMLLTLEPLGVRLIEYPQNSVLDVTSIGWVGNDSDLVFIAGNENRIAYRYNDDLGITTSIIENQQIYDLSVGTFAYSSEERYIAILGKCLGQYNTPCIFDLTLNQLNQLPPNSADMYGSYGQLRWHPKENWILIGEFVEEGRIFLRITNSDGSIARELGYNCTTPICFGWLPSVSVTTAH
ncbi:MAG: hypothetical protein K8L91_30875 [Anaerolineae bacterium]|nr:hypothetical protein [Anaerolineae bacterium]